MRLLLAAFACQPGRGSEPGVGWAFASSAAGSGHDVVLVTQRRNRRLIEGARAADPELARRLAPVYVGLPAGLMDAWDRHLGLRGLQLYNLAWQLALARAARRVQRTRPVDCAHHVTLSSDWMPSGLALVPGLRFVWGPLGGSERVPPSCRRWLGRRGRAVEALRRLTADPLRRLLADPAAARASLLLAQNHEVAARFAHAGPPVVVRPNVFLDPADWPAGLLDGPPPRGRAAGRRRAVFAGRLLGWKGVFLALDTMARPELSDWELHLYGEGPERADLERRIDRLGLADRVVLHGAVPRAELLGELAAADAFFFPSLREAAGWVVAEALMTGCPVVCLDHGGPPVLVAGGPGVAVAPGPSVAADLAAALSRTPDLARTPRRWELAALPGLLDRWYAQAADPLAGARPATLTTDVGGPSR